MLEAPRGTLFHHYEIDDDGLVTRANLIVSTTNNNQAMNTAIRQVAAEHLDGREATEPLLNTIEVAIRAYDPCLSCATHAVGRMPLLVDLEDAEGVRLNRLVPSRRDPLAGGRGLSGGARAPGLILACGNPARGDDALGPLLLERLALPRDSGIETFWDYQLQIEYVLDLAGRAWVVFVDAAVSGAEPFDFRPVVAEPTYGFTTHALSPGGLLAVCMPGPWAGRCRSAVFSPSAAMRSKWVRGSRRARRPI